MVVFFIATTGIQMAQKKLIDGVALSLRNRDFTVPAMTFGQIKRLKAEFETLKTAGQDFTPESHEAIITIVHTAMMPNHPELTRDELEDLLDPTNIATAFNAIMGASGLAQSGEARAATKN